MTDLLHNRELVVWRLSVMTSFYAAMECCIVGSWKSVSTSTCLAVYLNVKHRQIRDQSVLISRSMMEDAVSRFCIVKKWICFFFKVALKKLVGELETTVRVQKQRLQPGFESRVASLFCSSAAQHMQSLKIFQRQSTWTCDRYWTFSDLASRSNHLPTDHQHLWWQCDEVGNYQEQGDAEGAVVHSPLVATAFNYLQTCDDAFSCFWKVETGSKRWS